MSIDSKAIEAAKRICAMRLGTPTYWKDADAVARALLDANGDDADFCGVEGVGRCVRQGEEENSFSDWCRHHILRDWERLAHRAHDNRKRAEIAEAELAALRQAVREAVEDIDSAGFDYESSPQRILREKTAAHMG